jgi:hypothetical protein
MMTRDRQRFPAASHTTALPPYAPPIVKTMRSVKHFITENCPLQSQGIGKYRFPVHYWIGK